MVQKVLRVTILYLEKNIDCDLLLVSRSMNRKYFAFLEHL
jgi:hypothetical protein